MQQLLQQQVLNSPQLQNQIQAVLQHQQQQQTSKSTEKQQITNLTNNSSTNTNDNQMQLLENNLLFQQLTSNLAASPIRNRKQLQQQNSQIDAGLLQQQQFIHYLQKCSQDQQYLAPYLMDLIKNQQGLSNLNNNNNNNSQSNNGNNSNISLNKGLAELLGKELLLNRTNTPDQSDIQLDQQQLLITALAMSQSNSMPNRSTNSTTNSIANNSSLNISEEDNHTLQSNKRSNKTPEVSYKLALFSNGSCKWPSCDQQIPDYQTFLQHLSNEHQLDDRSTAQARLQLEMVQQLESNLSKAQKVLQAMVTHLENQKELNPTKHNLFIQNLSSIQNNSIFRTTSKSGLNSPLSNQKLNNNNQISNLNGNNSANDEDDRQSFGSSPRLCNSIPFSGQNLSTTSPTSPISSQATNNNRHHSSYQNHLSHHSPNSTVNNHLNSNKTNSINSGLNAGNELQGSSPFTFNHLSSNFSNSSSLPNNSLSNFSLLTSHQSNNSTNLNSVLNGQSLTTTSSNNCSLVNGLNSVSMCNGNSAAQNNLVTGTQSNQNDLNSLHLMSQQHSLSNNKAGPGRRRQSDKHNLDLLLDYQGQMIQGFNDPPKGRRIVERATSDINDDMIKNREYYTKTDIRPPYTYASLIRQVNFEIYSFFKN